MKSMYKSMFILCCIISSIGIAEQQFVIKKEKKKKLPSFNTLKEQYAQESGKLIKIVPKIHKHAARIQRKLIKDFDDLLNNIAGSPITQLTKEQLEEHNAQIVQLTHQLEELDKQLNNAASFLIDKK